MSPQEIQQESQAFISWLSLFQLSRPVTSLADLSDGAALFDVLAVVDEEYFRNPSRSQASDNWVIRFSQLKRLFRLITQYFADVLHRPTASLEVPNLQAIAQDHNVVETLALCRLTIAIAVQGKKNMDIIAGIQKLPQADQRAIMTAIEKVMSRFADRDDSRTGDATMTDDDHYYQIQLERSRALAEKETLEKVYQQLLEEHRKLQTNFDDTTAEREEINSRLRDLRRQLDDRRHDKSDGIMRAEIDRLRADLQKTEENLGTAEVEAERQGNAVKELTRRVEELQSKADEAARLKDQVDEYRHAAEKLHKTENVMEKYKKKLEESADLRRHVKSLEEQNATLVDKNAALEEENRKVAAYKPLMESYKTQIADLENKVASRLTEIESVRFELSQSQSRLRQVTEERAKDSEALELYQERVRELELATVPRPRIRTTSTDNDVPTSEPQTPAIPLTPGDELDATSRGLGGELNDAITGTTTTDLKLQIRALKRDLEAARAGGEDASRVLVLESLLEDSQRMKSRYEEDYLTAHREKLLLQAQLEEIRSGKATGDSAEAAIALRQRLNESVEQLDALRREHAELQVKFETQARDLTVAKSDLNLVNKDQLEILATLRESVNEDKAGMEVDMTRLRNQITELKDKNKMQLEQGPEGESRGQGFTGRGQSQVLGSTRGQCTAQGTAQNISGKASESSCVHQRAGQTIQGTKQVRQSSDIRGSRRELPVTNQDCRRGSGTIQATFARSYAPLSARANAHVGHYSAPRHECYSWSPETDSAADCSIELAWATAEEHWAVIAAALVNIAVFFLPLPLDHLYLYRSSITLTTLVAFTC
ncbi:hypothetical protein FS749_014201 [Ceratobasidium sp. UAMH 11750]|nr:hypothetical protein FS749_014201 [Ceratobasidium sp. UAMH 11750]